MTKKLTEEYNDCSVHVIIGRFWHLRQQELDGRRFINTPPPPPPPPAPLPPTRPPPVPPPPTRKEVNCW
jgi:hypothetical protein